MRGEVDEMGGVSGVVWCGRVWSGVIWCGVECGVEWSAGKDDGARSGMAGVRNGIIGVCSGMTGACSGISA